MLPQVPPSRAKKAERVRTLSEVSENGTLKLTEEELDALLDPAAVSQELVEMYRRGVAPSQVVADVTEVIRWQDKLQATLDEMTHSDPGDSPRGWVTDLLEDLIAYEVSPSHSVDETHTILKELLQSFVDLENSGYGPEARNFISSLKAELEILIEKLLNDPKS